jgi:hypothetical protein
MGFFSWKCCVSGKSLMNIYAGQGDWAAYLVTPDRTYYESAYDGYGDFDGVDVYELIGDGDRDKGIQDYYNGTPKFDIKVVLRRYYTGQTYDQLPKSEDCPRQGYF